jgi:hypothetical protein
MRSGFVSLLLAVGLFLSLAIMPAIAHTGDFSTGHSSDFTGVEETVDADHSHPSGSSKDMPCHAVNHHHCSVALHLDSPQPRMSGLLKAGRVQPAATSPLVSRSQAPPLNPPTA